VGLVKQNQFNTAPDRNKTNAEKYVHRKKTFGTEDLLPMWLADMDIETPPFIVDAIKHRAEHPIYGYEKASDALFESQVKWISDHYGWTIQRDWLFLSPSVIGSINVAIRAFSKPGDKIIVQSPVYPKLYTSVTDNDRVLLENPLIEKKGLYSMDFEALEASIDDRTRMMILCSPHNPVGRVWRQEELIRLGELCIKHNMIVVSDEIHSDLIDPHFKHIPFASLSQTLEQRTITCYGPGKTFNLGGLSCSSLCIPSDQLRAQFKKHYQATDFGDINLFGQVAFETAYTQGDEWLKELLTHLKANIDYLDHCLKETMPLIKMKKPEGTYLAWLDCRALGLEQTSLHDFFYKEAKLGLSSGSAFGTHGNGFMRLNFAVSNSTMKEAILKLQNAYSARGYKS